MKSITILPVLIIAISTVLPVTAEAADACPRNFAGTVEINSTQMAFIVSGQSGGGVLEYAGNEHEFTIGGLGIGGIGIQKINAVGAVYNLENLGDFNGTYLQGRVGITVGKGKGQIGLSNSKCVIIELQSSTKGAALSLGADGMSVRLK